MALDAQLQELLREPRERLDVELKGWLNLTDNGHRGVLAKSLIAIAKPWWAALCSLDSRTTSRTSDANTLSNHSDTSANQFGHSWPPFGARSPAGAPDVIAILLISLAGLDRVERIDLCRPDRITGLSKPIQLPSYVVNLQSGA